MGDRYLSIGVDAWCTVKPWIYSSMLLIGEDNGFNEGTVMYAGPPAQ